VIDSSDTADDLVVLVDGEDATLGVARKFDVHADGRLHRAVSVMLFDSDERVLLQRRAAGKYHSAGLWSNTCCGHPRPNESVLAAAHRRLHAEMGIKDCELTVATPFVYRESVTAGLVEHELDYLFVGVWNDDPQPDPEEVSDWRWMRLARLQQDIAEHGERYTAWLSHVLEHLPALARRPQGAGAKRSARASHPEGVGAKRSTTEGSLSLEAVQQPWHESDPSLRSG